MGKILSQETLTNSMTKDNSVVVEAGGSIRRITMSNFYKSLMALSESDGTLLQDRCFCIKWSLDSLSKTVTVGGNILLYDQFKKWVDQSPAPCEIRKSDKSIFYLNKSDFTKRVDGASSKKGDTSFLQMVEFENINIAAFVANGEMQIWFNMDGTCPAGFRRWFSADKRCFGRYTSHYNADGSTFDVTQGTTYGTANMSAAIIRSRNAATGIVEQSDWEYTVMSWIFTAYYLTVNHQSIFQGIDSGAEAVARAYVNGTTDTLTVPHGRVASTVSGVTVYPFRFMYIENFYGLQWIWTSGVKTNAGNFYLCYDPYVANTSAAVETLANLSGFELIGSFNTALSGTYPKNVDINGVCTETGGSSSTGFCDGQWSNATDGNISYRGGYSAYGSICGGFARYLSYSPSYANWAQRGRSAF